MTERAVKHDYEALVAGLNKCTDEDQVAYWTECNWLAIKDALELARDIQANEKVVVPREPTEEMIAAMIEAAVKSEGVEIPLPDSVKHLFTSDDLEVTIERLSFTGVAEYKAAIRVVEQ